MTPYYQDDYVTIYHGDMREWSGSVSAILTDPPYGRAALPLWAALANLAVRSPDAGGWLLTYSGQATLPQVLSALGVDGLAYCWALATVYPGGEQMARIGDMTVLTGWKPVLAYRRRPFGSARDARGHFIADGRTGFCDVLPRGGREKGLHDWAQPIAEASELVARFTAPGDTILDPFAGSGTFLAAAKAHGRRAVGIEVDEAHCERAAIRLSQEVLGLVV